MQSYEVLVSDFNRIENEARSVGTEFAFALACLPVAITLTVTLVTIPIPTWKIKAPFMIFMFVCYVLGAFFLIVSIRQGDRLKNLMQTIKDSQVAPLGEKDSEMGPSDVENLAPEEEPKIGADSEHSRQ